MKKLVSILQLFLHYFEDMYLSYLCTPGRNGLFQIILSKALNICLIQTRTQRLLELPAFLISKKFSQSEDISCFGRETRWLCPLFPKQEDQSRGEWSTNKLHPPISLLRLSLPFSDCVCIFLICICVYFLLMFCVFPAVTNG